MVQDHCLATAGCEVVTVVALLAVSVVAGIGCAGLSTFTASVYFGFCLALHKINSDGVMTLMIPFIE